MSILIHPTYFPSISHFVAMTKELANKYESVIVADQLQSVKGGYLVFYQYERNNDDWLAVAILNKTEGIDVAANLEVVASEILDLKKLHYLMELFIFAQIPYL